MASVPRSEMRLRGNFYSEWTDGRSNGFHHALFVAFIACAVGAASSAAVILHLVDASVTRAGPTVFSPRVIWRINSDPVGGLKTLDEPPRTEAPAQLAKEGAESVRDDARTKTETQSKVEVLKQHFRKHRMVPLWRDFYWRRDTHNSSGSARFGSW